MVNTGVQSHLSQEILDAAARGDAPRLGNIQFCWRDKTRQQLHRKEVIRVAFDNNKKMPVALEKNSSQSETALCSAVVAQSGTDTMVSMIPWPVPGHQRLDARQSPLGASQHAEKKN